MKVRDLVRHYSGKVTFCVHCLEFYEDGTCYVDLCSCRDNDVPDILLTNEVFGFYVDCADTICVILEDRVVVNEYGKLFCFDLITSYMDSDLKEQLASEIAPCTMQYFFDAYIRLHRETFGEDWELAKENPCY